MALETNYGKHKITYREIDDRWIIEGTDIEARTLGDAKKKVDELSKSDRRIDVKALYVSKSWGDKVEVKEVNVALIALPRYGSENEAFIDRPTHRNKPDRTKVNISTLVPLAERAAVEAYRKASEEAKVAQAKAEKLADQLPRHTADSLRREAKKNAS